MPGRDAEFEQRFHDYYRDPGPPEVRWLGVSVLKCPMDLWIYQELIEMHRPDFIIEGGTCSGGSALFMATICDAIGHGIVITVDWDEDKLRPRHNRILYATGDTLKKETWDNVNALVSTHGPRMIILDDGHDQNHVHDELDIVVPMFLRQGDILIVEDTDLGGPLWGLDRWLTEHPERSFSRIDSCEKLKLTFNPKGYLRCNA